ncbi:MAG: sterol desaturase [Novosphingobium sp.]|nr:sterol desaturase [Novosphingobium sp.]
MDHDVPNSPVPAGALGLIMPMPANVGSHAVDIISDKDREHGQATKTAIKTTIFKYYQPATVLALLLFWGLGPKSLTENPLTLVILGPAIIAMVLSLEWVNERHKSWRLTEQEFLRDLYWFVFTRSGVIALIKTPFINEPLKALKANLGISTPWFMDLPFVVQVAVILALVELTQYWIHRALHNQAFLWRVHVPHHFLLQMNTLKSGVGNPLEFFVLGLTISVFLDVETSALFCAASIGGAVAKFAHANVRFDPPRWYSFIFTTIESHSVHHSSNYDDTRSNYSNALIIWDRIFGTYRDGDAEIVGCQEDRQRQSLLDQHIYPIIPAIDWIKLRWMSRPRRAP